MSEFREHLNSQLKNPAFKAESDALDDEFIIIQAMIERTDAKAASRAHRHSPIRYQQTGKRQC